MILALSLFFGVASAWTDGCKSATTTDTCWRCVQQDEGGNSATSTSVYNCTWASTRVGGLAGECLTQRYFNFNSSDYTTNTTPAVQVFSDSQRAQAVLYNQGYQSVSCPACAASSCGDCTNSLNSGGTCVFYTGKATFIGQDPLCTNTALTSAQALVYDSPGVSNTGTCPPAYDNLKTCSDCYNQSNNAAAWYSSLPNNDGTSPGVCSSSGPTVTNAFKVPFSLCKGPVCRYTNCRDCLLNATDGCAWYTPNTGAAYLYSPKCDSANNQKAINPTPSWVYNNQSTCPACGSTDCTSCKAEAGCRWVAINVGVTKVSGQCVTSSGDIPAGKTVVDTCPSECLDMKTCKDCAKNSKCAWYRNSAGLPNDQCDFDNTYNVAYYGGTGRLKAADCSALSGCLANDCASCTNLKATSGAACKWVSKSYVGVVVPKTQHCTDSESNTKDVVCPAANAAGFNAPGLLVALFVLFNLR